MVSPTKGHCIRQLPLGGLLGMKGLLVLCVCVCLHVHTFMHVESDSQAAILRGETK